MQGTSHVAAAAPPGLTLPGVGTISGTTGATQALDAISADGTKIALWSDTDLVGNEATGPDPDVFVYNTVTGAFTRVSVSNSGGEVDGDNTSAWISDDGRYVAFKSAGAGFVAGDTNGTEDAFVRDTQAGTTTRVSVDDNGAEIAAGPDELAAALATGGRA
jgi:hypothetical protein